MTARASSGFRTGRWLRTVALAVIAGVVLIALAGRAQLAGAQQAPVPSDVVPRSPQAVETPRSATPAGKGISKRDVIQSPEAKPGVKMTAPAKRSKAGLAAAFWIFAAMTILGSIFVLTRKNLIAAVMGMVGTFFALAALYMLLYAHFLAIIQMLVYAGAIMVLFVFVIMILNKPEDEPYGTTGRAGKILAGLAMAYLVFRIGSVLVDVPVTEIQQAAPPVTAEGYAWGSTAAVGWNLFNDYLFPFEAVSILLLIAVVGAIAVARPLKDGHDGEGGDDNDVAPAGGH